MISKRRRASITKHKDSGVSEVIGDILILAMTVTLFSTVFFFVNAFPTPNAQTYANFNATLTAPSDTFFGTNSVLLNITHQGGQELTSSLTSVIIQINQSASVYTLLSGYKFVNSTSAVPWASPKWSTSQTWIINLTGVTNSSVVGVSILDKANNFLVWSTVLRGKSTNAQPVLQGAFANPNPVTPGNNITIFANIYSQNKNLNVSANVSFVSSLQTVYLTLNSSSGLYQTSRVRTSSSLLIGASYPITIEVKGPGKLTTNQTFYLSAENTGPRIVVSNINPNPATPGTNFTITAYVVDNNQTSFNPPFAGTITVTPQTPIITNITKKVSMNPTSYSGIFTLTGHVNDTISGNFEPFYVTAMDTNGNKAIYTVELVVVESLNPSQNQSFPSKYLGPTSMSFSDFRWNPYGISTFYPGSLVNTAYLPGTGKSGGSGIFLNVKLQNHNLTSDLYLDDLSNIYLFFGAATGFSEIMSFIVYNSTSGNALWNVSSSSTTSNPAYNTVAPPASYPSLNWNNGPTGPWSKSFILLPAAVGGVIVPAGVTFGAQSTGNSAPVPATQGGPFAPTVGSANGDLTAPSISTDFLELFGYFLPAGTQPWLTNPSSGVAFGQTLPFTSIYWS